MRKAKGIALLNPSPWPGFLKNIFSFRSAARARVGRG